MFTITGFVAHHVRKESLFQLRSAAETGIDFNTEIINCDTFNILIDEYIFNGGGFVSGDIV
jgi:hypothetical protein